MILPFQPNFDWHEIAAALNPGEGRRELEAAIAARVGAPYALAFAYGRSAMVAVFKALGLNQAEIILPGYTCQVVAEAVVVSGNRPVFVDIDLADFNINSDALKRALTPQTRAIIATHMHGYPADIAAIRNAIGDERIVIVEDAALLGPVADWMNAGARGDVVVFSFSPGKHLYAVQGGCLVTQSAALYEKLKLVRDGTMSETPRPVLSKRVARMVSGYLMLNASLFNAYNKFNSMGPMKQLRDSLGITPIDMPRDYATVLSDFQARIALAQLRKYDAIVSKHRMWAKLYDRLLRDVPGLHPAPLIPGATYAQYAPRIHRRDAVHFPRKMRERGVGLGISFQQVAPLLPAYQTYLTAPLPCVTQAANEVVNLPNYARLDANAIRAIAAATRHVLEEATQ